MVKPLAEKHGIPHQICVWAQKYIAETFSENRSNGTGKVIKDGWNIDLQAIDENLLQFTIVAQNNSQVELFLGDRDIMDSGNDIIVLNANDKQNYCLDKQDNSKR